MRATGSVRERSYCSRQATKTARVWYPSFLRGRPVQLVGCGKDILVGKIFYGYSLNVSLVLRTLPDGVWVGEEDLGAPLLHLGEVSELVALVQSNGFKDLRKVFTDLDDTLEFFAFFCISIISSGPFSPIERIPQTHHLLAYQP